MGIDLIIMKFEGLTSKSWDVIDMLSWHNSIWMQLGNWISYHLEDLSRFFWVYPGVNRWYRLIQTRCILGWTNSFSRVIGYRFYRCKEWQFYMVLYVYICLLMEWHVNMHSPFLRCQLYFQMVCQDLCQNSVSGWGLLEVSLSFVPHFFGKSCSLKSHLFVCQPCL